MPMTKPLKTQEKDQGKSRFLPAAGWMTTRLRHQPSPRLREAGMWTFAYKCVHMRTFRRGFSITPGRRHDYGRLSFDWASGPLRMRRLVSRASRSLTLRRTRGPSRRVGSEASRPAFAKPATAGGGRRRGKSPRKRRAGAVAGKGH